MTRKELLKRLLDMEADGCNMDAPVVMRVYKKVADKRRSTGCRLQHMYAAVEFAENSTLSFSEGDDRIKAYARKREPFYEVAQLTGNVLSDWQD